MILKKNYVQRSRAGLHEGTGGRKASTRLCREPWAEQSIPTKPCPPSTTCCVIFGSSFPLSIPPPCIRVYGVLSITVPSFLAAGPGASSRRRAVLLRSGRRGDRWRGRCSRSSSTMCHQQPPGPSSPPADPRCAPKPSRDGEKRPQPWEERDVENRPCKSLFHSGSLLFRKSS